MSHSTFTPPAELLLVEGPDSGTFLQTQLSSDVAALAPMHWQFGAWLDATGRVKAFFHLAHLAQDRWLMLLRGGHAQALRSELQRYVFRSRLSLSTLDDLFIAEAAPMDMYAVGIDEDQGVTLGCGDHSLRLSREAADTESWRARHIDAGWPWLPSGLLDTLLAPSLSLHRLRAVALDKGCYPGQEIVARLHYRGGNKRHLYTVDLFHPIAPGTRIEADGDAPAIQLLDSITVDGKTTALAVIGAVISPASQEDDAPNSDTVNQGCVLAAWPA